MGVEGTGAPQKTQNCGANVTHSRTFRSPAGRFRAEGGRGMGASGITRNSGHTPPLGWSYAPRTSPSVGPYGGACP